MHLQNIALVLEGGGMRGMFSAGVFEAFLARNITFPYITAVSAGACNILSYMSAQPLRTRQLIEKYVTDKRYFSLRNWLKNGSVFGFDFIFEELPKHLLPFDYAAYRRYPGILQVGTTDISSGETIWFDQKGLGEHFLPVRASSSMPFVAPVVHFNERALLDGALTQPIPYQKALDAGFDKLIVVLTRNAGYRKKKSVPQFLLKTVYKQYPRLWDIMQQRPALYNAQLEAVEQLEREGKAIIIRPQLPLTIDKFSIKPHKLLALHDHGIGCGLAAIKNLKVLMEK